MKKVLRYCRGLMTPKPANTPARTEPNRKPRRLLGISVCGVLYEIQFTKLVRVFPPQVSTPLRNPAGLNTRMHGILAREADGGSSS